MRVGGHLISVQNLETAKAELENVELGDYYERWEKRLIQLSKTYLPNVYKLGGLAMVGETAIYLTLYMTKLFPSLLVDLSVTGLY